MVFIRTFVCAAFAVAAAHAAGQAVQRTRVIGTITQANSSAAILKTDTGSSVSVIFLPGTKFQRVAPGETDLSKAQAITANDLAAGDRVLARGTPSEDGKTLSAQSVILMSARDIAQKNEQERSEWIHRGLAGIVVSADAAKQEIQLRVPSMFGQARTAVVAVKDSTRFRRYAPDSVRFSDAKASSFAELKPGDQLRARGEKSEDGTRIAADEVVSGSFRTVAGSVTSVDAGAGRIEVKNLASGEALSVKITPDSVLRRLPQFAGFGAGAGGQQHAPGAPPSGGPGFPGAGARPAGAPDMQQMLERMPAVTLAEIRPGETIIVASTRGAQENHLTAVTLLAGADALLAMRQAAVARAQGNDTSPAGQPAGNWNLGDMSMMPAP